MQYDDVVGDYLKLSRSKPEKPDLRCLSALVRAFHRMPFENLTKILRFHEISVPAKRPRMPEIVMADHVDFGAGGTCFSLTFFFLQVLSNVGYVAYPVMCDRSYGPNTHCAIIVVFKNSKCLIDPGYLMEAPILIPPHGESHQRGAFSTVRLLRLGTTSQMLLITERDGKSKIRYRLRDEPVDEKSFFQRWIDSFDWAMMHHICVSRQTAEGQLFMRDGLMRRGTRDGQSQEVIRNHFAARIEKGFGIDGRLVMNAHDCILKSLRNHRDSKGGG